MRRFLLGLIAIVVVSTVAASTSHLLVDWNSKKDHVIAAVRAATGQDVEITGGIDLSLLPTPVLTATSVRLDGLTLGGRAGDGALGPPHTSSAELEELELGVAFWPLLAGRVEIEEIVFVRPTLLLNVSQEDSVEPVAEVGESPLSAAGKAWATGRLGGGTYAIEDGTVVVRDPSSGDERRIEEIYGSFTSEAETGRSRIDGRARVQGEIGHFDVVLDQPDDSGAAAVQISLTLSEVGASGRFGGSLQQTPDDILVEGRLTGQGESLGQLVVGLSGGSRLEASGIPDERFVFEADLGADLDDVSLSNLFLEVGESRLKGDLAASWRPSPSQPGQAGGPEGQTHRRAIRANLAATSLDLDWLLRSFEEGAGRALGALPKNLEASLDLKAGKLRYRGQDYADAEIKAGILDGALVLDRARLPLSGGGEVSLHGHFAEGASGLQFEGFLTAIAETPAKAFAGHLPPASEPGLRSLGPVTFGGEVFATSNALELRKFDLAVGDTLAHGGLVVSLEGRPAVGMGLLVDRIDLGPLVAAHSKEDGSNRLNWESALALLGGVDANIDLRVEHVTHPQADLHDLSLVATLADSELSVRTAQAQDASGNSITFSGKVLGLARGPKIDPGAVSPTLDGRIEARIVAPGQLLGQSLEQFQGDLGLDLSALTDGLPLEVNGDVSTGPTGLTVKLGGKALGGRFGVTGVVRSLGTNPDFALTLEAKHRDLAKLARRLAGRPLLTAPLGGFSGKVRLVTEEGRIGLGKITATLGPSRVEGTASLDFTGSTPALADLDMSVAVRHSDLAELLAAVSVAGPIDTAFGGIDMTGRIIGDPGDLRLRALSGRLGPLTVKGGADLRLESTRVSIGKLDLALEAKHPSAATFFTSLGIEVPAILASGPVELRGRASGRPAALRLSELSGRIGPIGLDGEVSADLVGARPTITSADLDIAISHPSLAKLAADLGQAGLVPDNFGGVNLRGSLSGDAGRLDISDLTGTIGPGRVDGRVIADLVGSKPRLDVDISTGAVPLALLFSPGNTERDGELDMNAPIDLSALGAVDADIRLRSSAWVYGDTELLDAGLEATLRRGTAKVKRLSGQLYGGTVQLSGQVAFGSRVRIDAALTAKDLEALRLIAPFTDLDRVSGPVTIEADVAAEGDSLAALLARLTGEGTIAGRLNVEGQPQAAGASALLGLLGGQGGGPDQAIDPTQGVLNAFAGKPARLSGSFALDDGTLRMRRARVDGAGARAVATVRADLAAWELESQIDLYRRDDLQSSYLTVDLSGPIRNPQARFGSKRVDVLLGSNNGSLLDRIEQFRGMLGEVVDFEPMARYVLGPHTETITPAQWSRFLAQYEKLFVSGYELPSGKAWTGDWKVESIRPVPDDEKGDQLVTIAFENKDGSRTKIGFRIREKLDALLGFKIVDAISDGVSFLVTQRSEFSSILRTQGVDGLIRVLERRFSDRPPTPDLPEVQDWEARRFAPSHTK